MSLPILPPPIFPVEFLGGPHDGLRLNLTALPDRYVFDPAPNDTVKAVYRLMYGHDDAPHVDEAGRHHYRHTEVLHA